MSKGLSPVGNVIAELWTAVLPILSDLANGAKMASIRSDQLRAEIALAIPMLLTQSSEQQRQTPSWSLCPPQLVLQPLMLTGGMTHLGLGTPISPLGTASM